MLTGMEVTMFMTFATYSRYHIHVEAHRHTCRTRNGSRVSKAMNLFRLNRMLNRVPARCRCFFRSRSAKHPSALRN